MISAWWLPLIIVGSFIAGFMTCAFFVVGKND
jgi:hypothetical protein